MDSSKVFVSWKNNAMNTRTKRKTSKVVYTTQYNRAVKDMIIVRFLECNAKSENDFEDYEAYIELRKWYLRRTMKSVIKQSVFFSSTPMIPLTGEMHCIAVNIVVRCGYKLRDVTESPPVV